MTQQAGREKSFAETNGTAESERFRRIVRVAIRTVGVVIVLRLFLYMMPALRAHYWSATTSGNSPVSYSAPARSSLVSATTGTLSMPPNGDSPRIRVPQGYVATFDGSGFTTHCVYNDGSEGVVGDRENPCRDGLIFAYVRNMTNEPNTVTYIFVRPK